MKNSFFFLLLFLFTGAKMLSAQDTIVKTNEERIFAKVLEVDPGEIHYKRADSPDGPLYVIAKTGVWKIVYADGRTEYFTEPGPGEDEVSEFSSGFFAGVNFIDFVASQVTAEAEYRFRDGFYSLRVPVSFGMNALGKKTPEQYVNGNYYYDPDKIISSGIGLLLYPGHHAKRLSYFVGPLLEIGKIRYQSEVIMQSPYYSSWIVSSYPLVREQTYFGAGITNGATLTGQRMQFQFGCSAGFLRGYNSDPDYGELQLMGRVDAIISFGFGNIRSKVKTDI